MAATSPAMTLKEGLNVIVRGLLVCFFLAGGANADQAAAGQGIELNNPFENRIDIDRGADLSCGGRRHGLEIVWIGHVSPQAFRHKLQIYLLGLIAQKLRLHTMSSFF